MAVFSNSRPGYVVELVEQHDPTEAAWLKVSIPAGITSTSAVDFANEVNYLADGSLQYWITN